MAALTLHQEFCRVLLRRTTENSTSIEVELELVANTGPPDAFASRLHRLQPAQGADVPEVVVAAAADALRAWELVHPGVALVAARQLHPPPTAPPTAEGQEAMRAPDRPWDPSSIGWLWLLAWALLPLLTLTLVASRALQRHAQRRSLGLAIGWTVAVPTAVIAATWSVDVPLDFVTPLHEGFTRLGVGRLFGKGIHAGVAYLAVVEHL